jgi:hypothetical protein
VVRTTKIVAMTGGVSLRPPQQRQRPAREGERALVVAGATCEARADLGHPPPDAARLLGGRVRPEAPLASRRRASALAGWLAYISTPAW